MSLRKSYIEAESITKHEPILINFHQEENIIIDLNRTRTSKLIKYLLLLVKLIQLETIHKDRPSSK